MHIEVEDFPADGGDWCMATMDGKKAMIHLDDVEVLGTSSRD